MEKINFYICKNYQKKTIRKNLIKSLIPYFGTIILVGFVTIGINLIQTGF